MPSKKAKKAAPSGIVKRADPLEPAGLCKRRLSHIVDRAED
jgi:hypothetical protein